MEKFAEKGTTPHKHTSNIFFCIPCNETRTQLWDINSSSVTSKQLPRRAVAALRLRLDYTAPAWVSLLLLSEEDAQERETANERRSYWSSPLFLPTSWICKMFAQHLFSECTCLRVVPSLPTMLIPQGEAGECPVAGGQPKIVTAPSYL